MIRRTITVLFIILLFSAELFSQPRSGNPRGIITGNVYDSDFDIPIEYATLIVYNKNDSTKVNGSVSDESGFFQITGVKPGNYYLEVSFVGYKTKYIPDINLKRGNPLLKIDDIYLEQTAIAMNDVSLVVEKTPIEYHIDKKVINVDKLPTAASGTAIDVLENVPSVTVDLEGNVQLRGSENFTVLIDGRPTMLESSEALEQIPASSIDNIEIITNPSAKYQPDGTSGIINIQIKKNKFNGNGGIVTLSYGAEDRNSADILYNYRQGIINASIGLDYSKRYWNGNVRKSVYTTHEDTTYYSYSKGESSRGRDALGLRTSIDFNLSSNDVLGIGFRWGSRDMTRKSEQDYVEWTEYDLNRTYSSSYGKTTRKGDFYSFDMNYLHRFAKKGHEISGQYSIRQRDFDEKSTDDLRNLDGIITEGRITTEKGPSTSTEVKVDYTLPLNNEGKFEAGYESRIGKSEDNTGLSEYDISQSSYIYQPLYSHEIEYIRNIHSIYTLYSGKIGNFGYQGGLRGEYTDRRIELLKEGSEYTIDRWDFFPTIHLSYKMTEAQQVMSSYSRRIQRTRGFFLEPFETWEDAYNVRKGNPDIQPEYIDSYEVSYQNIVGKYMFTTEAYYRVTHNLVEFIQSIYAPEVTLRSVENVGTSYALGTEISIDGDMAKWWNVNAMVNLFNNTIDVNMDGKEKTQDDFSWNSRLNNSFKISPTMKFQVNNLYNSPRIHSQGRFEGFFTTNLALEKELMKKTLSATFQVHDVFKTAKHDFTTESTGYYSTGCFERDAPQFSLTIRYNINNYKQDRRRSNRSNGEEDGEDF